MIVRFSKHIRNMDYVDEVSQVQGSFQMSVLQLSCPHTGVI